MLERFSLSAIAIVSLVFIAATGPAKADKCPSTTLEKSVTCNRSAWFWKEPRVLGSWAWIAGGHNTKELGAYISTLENSNHAQSYSLSTVDGRTVKGRKVSFSGEKTPVAVLVASGNLSTADLMVRLMEPVMRATKYDYYFLDYRGYGLSGDSCPSVRAFIQDFVTMGEDIRRKGYKKIIAYGPSFGGVILLNAVAVGLKLDKLVIDSVPGDLRGYDCDSSIEPVKVLGASCPNVIAFVSKNDQEFSPESQEVLLSKLRAQSCGGRVIVLVSAVHALDDKPGTPGEIERTTRLTEVLAEE